MMWQSFKWNGNLHHGKVGKGWWCGFLWRNGHKIVTQQGEKLLLIDLTGRPFDIISQMYDIIYNEMVDVKRAEEMEGSVFMNQKGKVVVECNRFGKKVYTILTHPEYCLFADETGCNMSMETDGHVAGTRYITEKGTQAQQMASVSEGQFTVLPFISANRQPVCFVVIFQSN